MDSISMEAGRSTRPDRQTTPRGTGGGLWRYRLAVASRAAAAIAGGYALSAASAAALAVALPGVGMTRGDAVMAATMTAFVVHAVAALWAFACASAWRAWIGIGVPAVVAGLWCYALQGGH